MIRACARWYLMNVELASTLAFFLGFGFATDELTVFVSLFVQGFHCFVTVGAVCHLDEGEPFRATGKLVDDEICFDYLSILIKKGLNFSLVDVIRKVADKKFHVKKSP